MDMSSWKIAWEVLLKTPELIGAMVFIAASAFGLAWWIKGSHAQGQIDALQERLAFKGDRLKKAEDQANEQAAKLAQAEASAKDSERRVKAGEKPEALLESAKLTTALIHDATLANNALRGTVTLAGAGYGFTVAPLSVSTSAATPDETRGAVTVPEIEICFRAGTPYEVVDISHGRILSTVKIGLRNLGRSPLSNCKVYIDKMSPEAPLPGGLPILLEDGGFVLRHDEPEKYIDIASHWNHVDQFRFNARPGWLAETMNFIADDVERVISVRIEATELLTTALFKIWTDETKKLRLERL
jgi:hypothetical protein